MNTDKLVKLIRYIAAIPKSLYVNLRLLPFDQAIKLPIIVSNRTKLISLNGKVKLEKVKTGLVRIGFTGADMIDYRFSRTMLQIDGDFTVNGKVKIGKGTRLIVAGDLDLGANFIATGDNTIICEKQMSIGSDCMFAWESVVMDTDQHAIFDESGDQINIEDRVVIGNNVWLGARSFVLKNSVIEDGCIVAANTTVTRSIAEKDVIIAGAPSKKIKEGVHWQH
ncbi:acyltransferase [Neptuniibacter sp. PT8_73]|uniref:acyltransferase n=1 Tax=Neptuniibacter sp. PT8_73 TaxID=3398206 RepID=UPI0039F4A83E